MNHLRLTALLALGLLPSSLLAGDLRTWTDQQGRQIQAEFVRIFNEQVILTQNGRTLRVPIGNLVEADQAFARAAHDTPREIPPFVEANFNDNDPHAEHAPEAERTWTDVKFNQIQASFVRYADRQVVLSASGHERSFPLMDFSRTDQNYVKEVLLARGEQAQAEDLQRAIQAQREPSPPPRTAGNSSAFPSLENHMAEVNREMQEMREQSQQQMAQMRAEAEARMAAQRERMAATMNRSQQSFAPSSPSTDSPLVRSGSGSSYEVAAHNSSPEHSYSSPDYASTPFLHQEELICQSCNKSVPSISRPGESCPHCGVYWSKYEDEHVEYAPGASRIPGWLIRLGIWGGIAVIGGGIGMVRRIFS